MIIYCLYPLYSKYWPASSESGKDSTANIQPNVKGPTMRVIGALISTISLPYNARGYVHSLI